MYIKTQCNIKGSINLKKKSFLGGLMNNISTFDNTKTTSIESIIEALIKACINSRPSYFKPYLISDKVTCKPNKQGFYEFFKYMLSVSKKTSEGELYLKIKIPNAENINVKQYKFYDTKHLHSRLTLVVDESKDSINIDILPF